MKKRRFFVLVMMLVIMAILPMTAFAKGSNPYKDVTKKTVGTQSLMAISYIKRLGGWSGVVKGNKFLPNKYMTRREYLIVLHNLYGDKVAATMADVRGANGKITSKFVCDRMVALSKVLKYPIKWTGTKDKMRRKDVARYIYIFATFNSALAPKK